MDHKEFRERYQYDPVKDLLGKGGFGRVFRARDMLLDRWVALKVFSREAPDRYDLISEIRRAIDLNHPNICRYYGAEVLRGTNVLGESQDIQVGVMELVEGGTIDEFLRKNPQHRKKLLADVLRGLSYLHGHRPSIIHRDLKPPNVLVSLADGAPVAKVTDFGISKSSAGSGVEMSSVRLGTYAYMAPEQLNPARFGVNGKIQCNLDLWAFGAMTIELLTGELPFGGNSGESTGQILEAIIRGIPAQVLNGFEEPYRGVLRRCMVQDASRRAQSAEELLSLLEAPRQSSAEERRQTVVEDTRKRQATVYEKTSARPKPAPQPRPQPVTPSPSPKPKKTEATPQPSISRFTGRNRFRTLVIFLGILYGSVAILGLAAEISFVLWIFFFASLIATAVCALVWKKYSSWLEWIKAIYEGSGWLLLVMSLALLMVPCLGATSYIDAYWRGDIKQRAILGYDYIEGNMYLTDPSRGAELLESACNANYRSACVSLGDVYRSGKGFSQDYAAAERYYAKACSGGDAKGCKGLGQLGDAYRNGDRVYKDDAKAAELYQKSCDGDAPYGCFYLGYAYEKGLGVKRDYARAAAPYQRSCDRGDASSCTNLGVLYEDGQGVARDFSRAVALYTKGCDQGDGQGCSNLGNCYHYGRGVERDIHKARELLDKGCKMGNQWGCDRLKEMQ
ncbi:MAG: protein kinase [Terracidiphilus sp.]